MSSEVFGKGGELGLSIDVWRNRVCQTWLLDLIKRERDIIITYMDKCKHFKIEADGQISKLNALDAGLTFLRRSL